MQAARKGSRLFSGTSQHKAHRMQRPNNGTGAARRHVRNQTEETSMRSMTRILLAGVLFAGSACMAAAHGPSEHSSAAKQPAVSAKAAETGAALRDLWTGHIFWVRNVAFATLTKNDVAANAAEQQVVENAKAIAGAIEPFYGAAAKDGLFKLLAGHYGAIKEYLVAVSAADSSAQGKAIQTLTKNAEDIAAFLSKANPHLAKDAVTGCCRP